MTSPAMLTAPLETSEKYSLTEPVGTLRSVENHRSLTRSFVLGANSTSGKSTRTIITLGELLAYNQNPFECETHLMVPRSGSLPIAALPIAIIDFGGV
jgi:hypothetical protein